VIFSTIGLSAVNEDGCREIWVSGDQLRIQNLKIGRRAALLGSVVSLTSIAPAALATKQTATVQMDIANSLKKVFSKDELAEVLPVYQDYCEATKWKPQSPPAFFYPAQDRGPGCTTRYFGVTFEDGTTGSFSMDKALRAIAV